MEAGDCVLLTLKRRREKKRGGYNFTLKLPFFLLLVCWSVYSFVTSGNEQKLNELSVVVFSCEKEIFLPKEIVNERRKKEGW